VGENSVGRYLLAVVIANDATAGSCDGCHFSFWATVCGIRRSDTASGRSAVVARHQRSLGKIRTRTNRDLSPIRRRWIRRRRCASREAGIRPLAHRSAASIFRDRYGPWAYRQGFTSAHASRASYAARSQIHREDHRGDLRIGLKESLVEEAMARAFDVSLDHVKRANMLLGDLGETLRLASAGELAEARLRLFHPIDFMLAS